MIKYLIDFYSYFTVNILSISNGLSASWTSVVEETLRVPNNPIRPAAISKDEFSWVSSVLYLGGFLGIFIWNQVADKFGRKINGYALACTQIFGWFGIIFSTSIIHLTISRFVMGLGGAGIITCSQLYINETANEKIKGPLCAFLIIAMQIGYLFVTILGTILPYNIFNICCLAVPLVFLTLFFGLPESPLYFLMHQKPDQAEKVLLWFNYRNEYAVEEKMEALTQSINKNEKPPPLRHLIADRQITGASFTAIVMLAGQQLCGYSFISSYTVQIFRMTNTSVSPNSSAIVVYIIQFITACVMAFAGKYAPKRLVMVISYFIASLSLASLSLFFFYKDTQNLSTFNWVPTVSLIIFIMCYSSGIGPASYMMLAEMFPAKLLNNVISVGLTVSISLAFITVKIFYFLEQIFSIHGTFLLYSLSNAALTLFVLKFVKNSNSKPRES